MNSFELHPLHLYTLLVIICNDIANHNHLSVNVIFSIKTEGTCVHEGQHSVLLGREDYVGTNLQVQENSK